MTKDDNKPAGAEVPAQTVRSDGKRHVVIDSAFLAQEGFDVSICRNGFQSTVVTMDKEMLQWLRDAIDEHLHEQA